MLPMACSITASTYTCKHDHLHLTSAYAATSSSTGHPWVVDLVAALNGGRSNAATKHATCDTDPLTQSRDRRVVVQTGPPSTLTPCDSVRGAQPPSPALLLLLLLLLVLMLQPRFPALYRAHTSSSWMLGVPARCTPRNRVAHVPIYRTYTTLPGAPRRCTMTRR
ncbi:hypothetical protein LY76DRAFT_303798 [Colletotrichum caudatum]|nr:hypothetical protein LY76DRAFT_303798 [Colletotrichum caudatum]